MSTDAPTDPIASYFDGRARGYDRQLWLEGPALRAAARLAEPLAGARVVDLAAGTGGLAAALVARETRLAGLVVVDLAPRMLQRAAMRLGTLDPTASFLVADARDVPLPDAAADVVTIGYLLHLLPPKDRAQVLAEAFRLLRPDGRLVVVVHGSPPGVAGRIYRAAWCSFARLAPRQVVGQGPMTALASTVTAAGFIVDTSRRIPGLYWSHVLRASRPGDRQLMAVISP